MPKFTLVCWPNTGMHTQSYTIIHMCASTKYNARTLHTRKYSLR